MAALDDDLNTPQALTILYDLLGALNIALLEKRVKDAGSLASQLISSGQLLGLLRDPPNVYLEAAKRLDEQERQWIVEMVVKRGLARKEKNFVRADTIREQLSEVGVILEDRPDGTTDWRRA
jgi:cysteinyl-tRNA synthetase